MDFHHWLQAGHCQPVAAFVAIRMVAEARAEFEKLLSLVEAGLHEAAAAAGEDEAIAGSEPWRRAVNIGKVIRDLAAANCERLGQAERRLSLQALAERTRAVQEEG